MNVNIKILKPRNPCLVASLKRKAGVHRRTKGGERLLHRLGTEREARSALIHSP